MGADDGIAVAVDTGLNPGHKQKHQGRATPLSSLEHDESHRSAGNAVGFEDGEDPALRGVEDEGNEAAGGLAADIDASRGPKLEIVATTQSFPLMKRTDGFRLGVVEHQARNISVGMIVVGGCEDAVAEASHPEERLIVGLEFLVSMIVFFNDVLHSCGFLGRLR